MTKDEWLHWLSVHGVYSATNRRWIIAHIQHAKLWAFSRGVFVGAALMGAIWWTL